jgi:RNA polymerase sigma factor (sigma-70 family)
MKEIPFSPQMMESLGMVAGIDGRQLEGNSNSAKIDALKEALPKAMEKLTSRQREVVIMYFWHDMTQQEIAEELGIAQPTVNGNIQLALKKLKKELRNTL